MFKKILSSQTIIAFALFLVTAAVNIAMPLFRIYADEANLDNVSLTLVLASYIAGMLPTYIFLGGISDRYGRKKILLISLSFAFLATLSITIFPTIYALIVARFFQGLSLALSIGTGTAYLTEVLTQKQAKEASKKAASIASFATAFGFSGGALATTCYLIYHFTTLPITFYILLFFTFVGFLLVLKLPNIQAIGGNLVRLPYFPKNSFPINMNIAICWTCVGTIIAIIPAQLSKIGLTAYAGFSLVFINWTGAFLQPFIRKNNPLTSVKIGYILNPLGFGIVILGCYLSQAIIIFLGTIIIGMSAYGFSYLGGLSIIANLGGEQKARAISGYMFLGYIGFGIPVIFLGFLTDKLGIVNALSLFELFIIILSTYLYSFLKKQSFRNIL